MSSVSNNCLDVSVGSMGATVALGSLAITSWYAADSVAQSRYGFYRQAGNWMAIGSGIAMAVAAVTFAAGVITGVK